MKEDEFLRQNEKEMAKLKPIFLGGKKNKTLINLAARDEFLQTWLIEKGYNQTSEKTNYEISELLKSYYDKSEDIRHYSKSAFKKPPKNLDSNYPNKRLKFDWSSKLDLDEVKKRLHVSQNTSLETIQ